MRNLLILILCFLSVALLAKDPTPEEIEMLRQRLLIPIPEELQHPAQRFYPSTSITCPTGNGLFWRDIGIGFSYVGNTPVSMDPDGGLVGGIGAGSPDIIGFEVSAFNSALIRRSAHGNLGVKLHRSLPWGLSAAVGADALFRWGVNEAPESKYIAVSRHFYLKDSTYDYFSVLSISLGVGNGRFQTESVASSAFSGMTPFASLSVLVARPISLILDWSANDLNFGASFLPIPKAPIAVTVAILRAIHPNGPHNTFHSSLSFGLTL